MSLLRQQIKQALAPKSISIVEFAESDEYCNKPLYPHQRVLLKLIFLEEMEGWEEDILTDWISGGYQNEVEISPGIRDRRDLLIEMGYPHFKEIDLVGGRRSGKGYMTALASVKLMYETQMLGDPGRHYSIDPQKEIYFTCVAASLDQAKKFQFSDFSDVAASCKPLLEHIPNFNEESFSIRTDADRFLINNLKAQNVKIAKNFSKLRAIPLAAQAGTIRGSASLVLVFDEMAHMIGTEGKASAEEVYKAAVPATRQFGRDSIIFCNSSPYTKIGQFYENVISASAMDKEGLPTYPMNFAIRYPSWEMFRNYSKDPHKRFNKALMVSPDWDISKMNASDKAAAFEARLDEKKNPEMFRVEYRSQWAEVEEAYLDPLMVGKAFESDYLGHKIEATTGGLYGFIYRGHCDPSSTTAGFGCAIAHIEEMPLAFGDKPQMAKHVVFDFVKRWSPEFFPNKTIDYDFVQKEIFKYLTLYRPYEFTFDQFNSTGPIQYLNVEQAKHRLDVRIHQDVATHKKNYERWEMFKTCLNLQLVHIPPEKKHFNLDPDYAEQELRFLVNKNGRIEKQDIGPVQTKDIADCIAAVTVALIGDVVGYYTGALLDQTMPAYGAAGGYPIGSPMPRQGGNPELDALYGRKGGNAPITRGIRMDRRR